MTLHSFAFTEEILKITKDSICNICGEFSIKVPKYVNDIKNKAGLNQTSLIKEIMVSVMTIRCLHLYFLI